MAAALFGVLSLLLPASANTAALTKTPMKPLSCASRSRKHSAPESLPIAARAAKRRRHEKQGHWPCSIPPWGEALALFAPMSLARPSFTPVQQACVATTGS